MDFDRDADSAPDPRVPSSRIDGDDRQIIGDIAMVIIWVLGAVAMMAWALRL